MFHRFFGRSLSGASMHSNVRSFSNSNKPLKKINFFHLMQAHADPRYASFAYKSPIAKKENLGYYFSVALSQYNVAQFILNKNPNLLVVESETENRIHQEIDPLPENDLLIRELFRSGWPKQFSELNQLQVDTLYDLGAVEILFHLGKLKAIYRSSDEQFQNEMSIKVQKEFKEGRNISQFSPELKKLILDTRELKTLESCHELATKQGSEHVDIHCLYGKAHDFKTAIAKYNSRFNNLFNYAGSHNLVPAIQSSSNTKYKEMEQFIAEHNLEHLSQSSFISALDMMELYLSSPWLLKSLAYHNICRALESKMITLDQLKKLTPEQIPLIKNKYHGEELRDKINELIAPQSTFRKGCP